MLQKVGISIYRSISECPCVHKGGWRKLLFIYRRPRSKVELQWCYDFLQSTCFTHSIGGITVESKTSL